MGRKRHLIVDSEGWLLAVVVHPANVQDFHGARLVLQRLATYGHKRLQQILADSIYKGDRYLQAWVAKSFGWQLQVVVREKGQRGFQLQPKRWVVERTFAWLGRWRRLSRDFEALPAVSEAFVQAAMIFLMTARLARL
jgi:putative transposase